MKRRIRYIFWLMVVCMVGINGFQAYWLYNTYQLATEQFSRTTNEALLAVVMRQQIEEGNFSKFRVSIDGTRLVAQGTETDSSGTNRIIVLSRTPGDTATVPRRSVVERHIFRRPLPVGDSARQPMLRPFGPPSITPPTVDLRRLADSYRAELRRRETAAEFVLDTVNLLRPTDGYGLKIEAPAGYTHHTRLVPLSFVRPLDNWQLGASFKRPTFHILRRMGGLLAGSVALLGLTTACFTLMLSTIIRQKKLSDVKNDFINNMTHELKTPLATVSAAVEAMQNFGALNDPAKTQAYLNISRNELQRLSDLVEKVLNIAVDERQQLELAPEPVQPAELVAEIVARHQLQAAKPVKFDVQVAPTAVVQVDKLHMGNVINNLIDNAIKYSKEAVTITIRGRQEPSGWHLTVADDGPGIEPSYQEAIFDRFFRVPTGNLHNVKGFGLGLYYVRQVVERHGGHIGVRSSQGQGSEFALWIPQQ
ncbi:MAG TPA: HAMP domain-containing sensor histidine kinase [Hymenobacter sp.]|jgi:signal transduction histidine kinase|uniref:sensor histidine kinase n=1 Tax=Hymenobacter sp. TaxID=1898978 RepID=UPI002EDB12BE